MFLSNNNIFYLDWNYFLLFHFTVSWINFLFVCLLFFLCCNVLFSYVLHKNQYLWLSLPFSMFNNYFRSTWMHSFYCTLFSSYHTFPCTIGKLLLSHYKFFKLRHVDKCCLHWGGYNVDHLYRSYFVTFSWWVIHSKWKWNTWSFLFCKVMLAKTEKYILNFLSNSSRMAMLYIKEMFHVNVLCKQCIIIEDIMGSTSPIL